MLFRIMKYRKCEICGLRSERKDGKKRFFMARFPLDEARCKQWVKYTGKEDLAYIPIEKLNELKFVCGKHFKDKDFTKNKTKLKSNAIPNLLLSAEPLSDDILQEFPCHLKRDEPHDDILEVVHDTQESQESSKSLDSKRLVTSIVEVHDHTYVGMSNNMNDKIVYAEFLPVEKTVDVVTRPEAVTCNMENFHETQARLIGLGSKRPATINIMEAHDHTYDNNKKRRKLTKMPQQQSSAGNQKATPRRKPSKFEDHNYSPRKRKLVRKLHRYKILLKDCRQKIKAYDSIKSAALKIMLKSARRNQNRPSQGKRWTKEDKSLAIAMYKKSPKLYRWLRTQMPLPSVRTLQTILQKIPMHPGINKFTLQHLQRKAKNMHPHDKIAVLVFDEMSLKKRVIYNPASDCVEGFQDLGEHGRTADLADKALVLMLQGVHQKFKQPIAHYFVTGTISSEKLSVIIKTAIKAVVDIGFTIVATVCDQGPTNVGALSLLKKNSYQPATSNHFTVDDNKIFIIFDVPHLLKSIRNNFFEAGEIVFDGKKAKWSHLLELHEKNQQTLHFKKISSVNLNPKFRAKMKVKYAAQVLSNDVAAILKLLAETYRDELDNEEHLKRDAILNTAEVISNIDKLFDLTNGPASKKDIKKGIRENVSEKSVHGKLWPEYKKKIKTMHFLKSDSQLRLRNVRCVNGYYTTISSLQDVWNYVHRAGFKYLNLRQLNQDALENFFGLIRQHSPTNSNPTCLHFTAALKSTILTKLSTPIRGGNCETDENKLMYDFHDVVFEGEGESNVVTDHDYGNSSGTYDYDISLSAYDDDSFPVLHLPDIDDNNTAETEERLFGTFDKQPVV